MKKTMISLLLLAATTSSFAQLKVLSNGHVTVSRDAEVSGTLLSVGSGTASSLASTNSYGVYSTIPLSANKYCAAVVGTSTASSLLSTATATAIGVAGSAGYGASGRNYGVMGGLMGTQNGAAIYGTTNTTGPGLVSGRYAGYFAGNAYITGTLTVPTVTTPSDMRLKENVSSLSDLEESYGSTLDNVLGLNVIEYNYKPAEAEAVDAVEGEQTAANARIADAEQRHFGLSAQELQQVYPNLVVEGDDGYLGVNYVELVPVLIRSIQELKAEVDALKGSGTVRKAPGTTGIAETVASGNVLYQNTPNPFKGQTTIRFQLADDATNAAICIFDMQGKLLKKLPVTPGMDSITVNGYELGEGMFLYTLMVNGQEVATKRMILSK